ncbi:MAG: very short patch repair endonuclease [Brevundimonas sp.]
MEIICVASRRASQPDRHTPEQRRHNMSRIRSRDTKPELQLRRALHAAGFRYRLHDRRLPGTPDLVLPARSAVIFVHGCFWHGHDCALGVTPNTRTDFWEAKIQANQARDAAAEAALRDAGWRVLTVWECALRGRRRLPFEEVIRRGSDFLRSDEPTLIIRGD